MRMNRRNVLVGLGTIVAGGGAALGTGAFSSVEATRDVTISVAKDSSAIVALVPGDSNLVTENEAGVLNIDLENINLNAVTTINEAFEIINNTGTPIDLTSDVGFAEGVDTANAASVVEFLADQGDSTKTDLVNDSPSEISLSEGEEVPVDIEIDTTGGEFTSEENLIDEITFTAEEQSD